MASRLVYVPADLMMDVQERLLVLLGLQSLPEYAEGKERTKRVLKELDAAVTRSLAEDEGLTL